MQTVSYRPILPEAEPVSGADKYVGAVAQGYDAKREANPKWIAEQMVIEGMLDDIRPGSWVLDCPVGTGRFLAYYNRREFCVKALDRSPDMLAAAEAKADVLGFDKRRITFGQGDIRSTGLADKCVDVSVMCRLTRWLSPADCVVALRELQRVTRQRIIVTARVRNHPHARPYELIASALDGWSIAKDEAGYHEDYRIIALEPTP